MANIYTPVDEKISNCSLTEAEANFLKKTRFITKKRKYWVGKQKPKEIKQKENDEKELVAFRMQMKKLKTSCVYCGKYYKGTYEENHKDECEVLPPTQ